MAFALAPQPWLILLDDTGLLVPNGQLAVYASGTSTPATVYTNSLGTAAHPWPITLDGAGRVPGGLFLSPGLSYKFVLHQPKIGVTHLTGAIIKTQDNVTGGGGILGITGSVPSRPNLPVIGDPGDAYITLDTGHLWVWDENSGTWIDLGPVQGPPGIAGPVGPAGPQGPQGLPGATAPHAPTHDTGGSDPITALAGTVITTGTVADARLSANVLKYAGGYPGGTANYLRADGTFAVPGRVVGTQAIGGTVTPNVTGLDVLTYTGGTNVLIQGFTGGVEGQQLTLKNLTGNVISLQNQSSSATVGNKLYNVVSVGYTLIVGLSGYAQYTYLSGIWLLTGHDQGAPYVQPFDGGNYQGLAGAFIWTVEAADVQTEQWYLTGRILNYSFNLTNTSVGAGGGTIGPVITRFLPNLWTCGAVAPCFIQVVGVAGVLYGFTYFGFGDRVGFLRFDQANWPNVNNVIGLVGNIQIPLA